MEFNFSTDQRQIKDAARRLANGRLEPILVRYPDNTPLPKKVMLEVFQTLAEFGLTGVRVPERQGGSGIGMLDYGLIFEELPPVVALALIAHDGTLSRMCASGAAETFPDLVRQLLQGEKIGCTASTEPTTGSDPRSIRLRVDDAGDGQNVMLTGTKQWITNGTIADVALVTGKLEANGELQRYLVERDISPFDATEIDCIGLKQGHLSELVFNQVAVPVKNSLSQDSSTMRTLTQAWLVNRPLFGLLGLALAEKARDIATAYVQDREQFGSSLARKQLIQEALVDIEGDIQSARLLCYKALDAADRGTATQLTAALAKRQGILVAERSASIAMRLCGAMGLANETGIEKYLRDIKMLTIPDGTYEILTLIAGRELTGQSAL